MLRAQKFHPRHRSKMHNGVLYFINEESDRTGFHRILERACPRSQLRKFNRSMTGALWVLTVFFNIILCNLKEEHLASFTQTNPTECQREMRI